MCSKDRIIWLHACSCSHVISGASFVEDLVSTESDLLNLVHLPSPVFGVWEGLREHILSRFGRASLPDAAPNGHNESFGLASERRR